jgi:EAL domain-containing protein (putative c-di-GMP-specific phosphodiesterase class I)
MYKVKQARHAQREIIDIRATSPQIFDMRGPDQHIYDLRSSGREIIDVRGAVPTVHASNLESELRSALAKEEVEVAYQPIVRNTDGRIVGVKALLRWTHPDRGVISPMSMIRVAEQTNLINDIGAWVLERSCRDHARWAHDYPDAPLDLAVNVSARQLTNRRFCAAVAGVLDRTDMDPHALVLEITENVLIDDGEHAVTVLSDLSDLGIRLALDDFGTGFSSQGYFYARPMPASAIGNLLAV